MSAMVFFILQMKYGTVEYQKTAKSQNHKEKILCDTL
jgi:hypothetical protein